MLAGAELGQLQGRSGLAVILPLEVVTQALTQGQERRTAE
uniref:Uncharacterized protein n=1 Tax=Ralstonia solanacearum TaxID=305 RepID=A0A0S4UG33_RALSL|nr:protein of unknown function [Ralstonia solanacearum]